MQLTKSTVMRILGAVAALALLLSILTHKAEIRSVLLGLGSGALITAIAIGVVLTYRGSGVVNFANGALAMFTSYIYDDLRRSGRLFLPPLPNPFAPIEGIVHKSGSHSFKLPHWPTSVKVASHGMGFWEALILALVVAAVTGAVMHFVVFKPLRTAPILAKVVASVGVLILLQATVVLRFSSTARAVRPVIKKRPMHLPGNILVPQDQILLFVFVVAVTVLLWTVFRYTKFGLATRAAAENEKGAILLGFSPDFLAGTNWVLSSVLAGLFGVLFATVNSSIDPITVTLLIVPALGAALLGSFTSFSLTAVAGLGIGMAQSLLGYLGTKNWFPHASNQPLPGVKEALPFLIVVAALFLRGRSLPTRGQLSIGRLPFAPAPRFVLPGTVITSALTLVFLLTLSPNWRLALTNTLIGVLICLSLTIVTGFVGQISLAQMALAGVAGFTLSKLTTTTAHVPFPVGPLVGAVVAAAFGVAFAIPALRVRGVNLAVVTLAASVAVENFVFLNPRWSGGIKGANVPPPRLGGLKFGPDDPGRFTTIGYHGDGKLPNPWFGVFCLIVVVALALMTINLRRSTTGRRMLAVRSNERAAAGAGVNVSGTKVLAFGLSAFVAGLAGGLSGYRFGSVTAQFFGSFPSLTFLAFAYIGGISSVTGAVLGGTLVAGGLVFTALQQWFHIPQNYTLYLGGIGLILNAVRNPDGLAGTFRLTGAQLARLRHRMVPAAGPPATAGPGGGTAAEAGGATPAAVG